MPRFAANLDWLFTEVSFLQRFQAASEAGFRGVEFLFPYSYAAADLATLLSDNQLESVMFNLPPGNWSAGERGTASLPGRESEFAAGVDVALDYAQRLGTRQLHALAGIRDESITRDEQKQLYLNNLRFAARKVAPYGITLLVEAINSFDMPGYFVRNQAESFAICRESGEQNVRMQLDLYHTQMTEGNLAATLRKYYGSYAHVQVASVPGRNEPGLGEINYDFLLDLLDESGYDGWVGCEYQPKTTTGKSIEWIDSARQLK